MQSPNQNYLNDQLPNYVDDVDDELDNYEDDELPNYQDELPNYQDEPSNYANEKNFSKEIEQNYEEYEDNYGNYEEDYENYELENSGDSDDLDLINEQEIQNKVNKEIDDYWEDTEMKEYIREETIETEKWKIYVRNNILFLPRKYIGELGNINSRLQQISQQCGGGFQPCGIYNNCESYVIMALDLPVTWNLSENDPILRDFILGINREPNRILGHIIGVIFKQHIEIYDFCVIKEERGGGIGRVLLTETLRNIDRPYVWLGIRFDNEIYERVLRTYVKAGFRNPRIMIRTPEGKNIGFPVLGLIYYKDIQQRRNYGTEEETINQGLMLQQMIDGSFCKTPLIISPNSLKFLSDLLQKPVEYSGFFLPITKQNGINILEIDKNNLYTGKNTPVLVNNKKTTHFSAPGIQNTITFHTHPEICYREFGCFLGWPSGPDMTVAFLNYVPKNYSKDPPQYLHIVATIEGLYYISLSSTMISIIDYLYQINNTTLIKDMSISIKKHFNTLASFRESTKISRVAPELSSSPDLTPSLLRQPSNLSPNLSQKLSFYVTRYFSLVSNFTILNLINSLTNSDLLLDTLQSSPLQLSIVDLSDRVFDVNLVTWNNLSTGSSIVLRSSILSNSTCPLFS